MNSVTVYYGTTHCELMVRIGDHSQSVSIKNTDGRLQVAAALRELTDNIERDTEMEV